MTAKLILRGKEYEVKSGTIVRHALEKIGVNSETVLATRNGELLTDDEIINDGDVIKLVAVISGGSGSPPSPLPGRTSGHGCPLPFGKGEKSRKLGCLRRKAPQTPQFPIQSPAPWGDSRG